MSLKSIPLTTREISDVLMLGYGALIRLWMVSWVKPIGAVYAKI